MSSTYGENIKMTIFGQSHSPAIGMVLEGIPAGKAIDADRLAKFMERRAPGRSSLSTKRREADAVEFIGGIVNGRTCGAPVAAVIRNTDARSTDYSAFRTVPRPGHADYTAYVKYGGFADTAGGGHFSGRLTAPVCIAGGICIQLLEEENIRLAARIVSIGSVTDDRDPGEAPLDGDFPVAGEEAAARMKEEIERAAAEGDSVGGVVECVITGIPAGLGDPVFGGMENRISAAVFGIPAVKGIEFGAGFGAASLRGSSNNDRFEVKDGKVRTATNNSGGILGGITNGMPLVFRAAFKPTPSIASEQQSVDLEKMENIPVRVGGRHDPCVVPRAVPCVEAAAAIAVYDAFLGRKIEL